jgi:hypothetical protein
LPASSNVPELTRTVPSVDERRLSDGRNTRRQSRDVKARVVRKLPRAVVRYRSARRGKKRRAERKIGAGERRVPVVDEPCCHTGVAESFGRIAGDRERRLRGDRRRAAAAPRAAMPCQMLPHEQCTFADEGRR